MTAPSWWFEIPSVEHPRLLQAALDEADRRGVTIGRIAMGSGLQLLTPSELDELLSLAHDRDVAVYAYVSARNSWEPLADPTAGEQLRGEEAFADAVDELRRAAAVGVDGVLVGDVGLLAIAGELRQAGELGDLRFKTAAAMAPHNAAAAALYERLGANSINVPSTATFEALLAMRRSLRSGTSIDIYIEAPADLGGGLRYREVGRFVTELAPVSLKIGIRNATPLYPYGFHLEPAAEQSIREKVRRAELALRVLERSNQPAQSAVVLNTEHGEGGGNGG
jgi:hypothetical protein